MLNPAFALPALCLRGALCASALLVCAAPGAMASKLWDWNYSGASISASGTFTTADNPNAAGGYLITGITGERNGTTINNLQPPGTSIPGNEPFTVDDLVFLGPGPQLTSDGFGFALANGTYSNPFYASFLPKPDYLEFFSMPASKSTTELPVQFSAVITPEPTTITSVSLILGIAGLLRRKSRRRTSVRRG